MYARERLRILGYNFGSFLTKKIGTSSGKFYSQELTVKLFNLAIFIRICYS